MAQPKRKKKRTQIRTASGTLQDRLFQKIETLLADPLVILPECDVEPKPITKARARLEKLKETRKPGFFDKKDKGLVGAIANAYPILDQDAIPRVADFKVGGKRRFYLQRGQVKRGVTIGVQNYDDPIVLMLAYVDMAKQEKLHFFAGDKLWCVGTVPTIPAPWLTSIDADLMEESPGVYGIPAKERVVIQFYDGDQLRLPVKKGNNWHSAVALRYKGPRQRQPFDVAVERNGALYTPDREVLAAYRGGIQDDKALARSATVAQNA
ncbi:MAG: hypothetical protein ACPHK8_02020 [Thermoplasmatota archaeon]